MGFQEDTCKWEREFRNRLSESCNGLYAVVIRKDAAGMNTPWAVVLPFVWIVLPVSETGETREE